MLVESLVKATVEVPVPRMSTVTSKSFETREKGVDG